MEVLENVWLNLGRPILLVSAIYFVVLFPTFLLLKKYKPSFWWMYLVMVGEVLVVNGIFYWLLFRMAFEYNIFFEIHFFGALVSVVLFLIFPLLLKNNIKKKKSRTIFLSYLVSFLSIYLIGYGIYYLIALSVRGWYEFF